MITQEVLQSFIADFNANKFPHQRFGQAFINTHGETCGIPRDNCSQLWEADRGAAEKMVWNTYVGETCPRCKAVVPLGTVQSRYSFTVYAGKFCETCCGGYRDNCGLEGAQGNPDDLDEPLDPEPYYGSQNDGW